MLNEIITAVEDVVSCAAPAILIRYAVKGGVEGGFFAFVGVAALAYIVGYVMRASQEYGQEADHD